MSRVRTAWGRVRGLGSAVMLSMFLLLILAANPGQGMANDLVTLRGMTSSQETGEPISRVTIRVEGTGISTLSNDDGDYRLRLLRGEYAIRFSHVGYYSETVTLNLQDSVSVRHVKLRPAVHMIEGMKVYNRAYDPAQAIIAEAIRRKRDILEQLHDYSFDAHTRLVVNDETDADSSTVFMIAESQITAYWERPDKFKEIITARRQTANFEAGSVILGIGESLNFNRNRIELGEYAIVSPTARDAMNHYNYYLLDTLMLDGRMIFRLEIEPKNPKEPLFVGFVHIADSTFDVVEVDVGVTEGVSFPFISDLKYSQQYAEFEDEFWMPIEIRYSGSVDLKVPVPMLPTRLSFYAVTSLYSYDFDKGVKKGTFDDFVFEVAEDADDVDSATWAERQKVPLTQRELDAYRRIDSVENQPEPLGKKILTGLALAPLLATGVGERFFHFNRVEGAYVGVAASLRRLVPRFQFDWRSGYAIDGAYWQHGFTTRYRFHDRRRQNVSLEYHDGIVRRPTITPSFEPTFLALTYGFDPYDYYLEKGFTASLSSKLIKKSMLRISYSDYLQYSAPVATDYNFLGDGENLRDNPAIVDGKYRSVTVQLSYDSRPLGMNKGRTLVMSAERYLRLNFSLEYADPDLLRNDHDFRRYWVRLRARFRLGSLGFSSIFAHAGSSDGELPPQRQYTVDYGSDVWYRSNGLNTLNGHNFSGNRATFIYIDHDFDKLPFERSGLPLLENIPFRLSVHGGLFWTEWRNQSVLVDDTIREARTAYSEIGFGLANLTPFLGPFNMALHFTWQLSSYDTSRFHMNWSIQL
ncbi:MAG: carboxypeptidase-like regulatory domain-containing protein [Candidatus Zixiibacteriota bacterium]|nr:MAG: carboxypeptidase-like regulatory domain-containing protein [candidate division Zixibacteria bacterium]